VNVTFWVLLVPTSTSPKLNVDVLAVSCPGAVLAVRVTVALAALDGAKALCAVTVTVFVGTLDGAVYKPAEEIVPAEEFPPTMPPTSQFIAVLLVPVTVAVNCCELPSCTLAPLGKIDTETGVGAGMIVTIAFAEPVEA